MAALAFRSHTTVRDPDIWWHLKVGDWIVEHHTVPYTGIFSRTAATHPWVAYSWAYEVLMSRAYAWFGLIGFGLYGVLLTMAVTFVLFWMLHRLSGRFWTAWILALVGSFAFVFSLNPRPVFVTMILFTVMLTLLLEAQRSGQIQMLYWLPLLFVVWANVHIQFLYGLAVVGLFVGINLLQRMAMWAGVHGDWLPASTLPIRGLIGILVGSLAATCIGPCTCIFELARALHHHSGAVRRRLPVFYTLRAAPVNRGGIFRAGVAKKTGFIQALSVDRRQCRRLPHPARCVVCVHLCGGVYRRFGPQRRPGDAGIEASGPSRSSGSRCDIRISGSGQPRIQLPRSGSRH